MQWKQETKSTQPAHVKPEKRWRKRSYWSKEPGLVFYKKGHVVQDSGLFWALWEIGRMLRSGYGAWKWEQDQSCKHVQRTYSELWVQMRVCLCSTHGKRCGWESECGGGPQQEGPETQSPAFVWKAEEERKKTQLQRLAQPCFQKEGWTSGIRGAYWNSEFTNNRSRETSTLLSPTYLLCGGKSSESSPSLMLLWKGLQDSAYSNAHGMIYLGKGTAIRFAKV